MEIILKEKNVYGNDLLYPNCQISLELIKLTGRSTFKPSDIVALKKIGYKVWTELNQRQL
jgi:hypothetical protein